MNKYPLLSTEVDITKIKISDVNYNDNKQFCHIIYNQNESLYLQSPILKFIEPIIIQQHSRNNYKLLYLFLTPQDSTTYSFIELINKLEGLCLNEINNSMNKTLNINSLIKIHDTDSDDTHKQIYMYIKITLLDQTKIEYNNRQITLDELNNLVRKVNLKIIFEINMLWLSQTKIGIYLKPIKIRAIDIIEEPILSFRDDDSPIHNNILMTEIDNINNIVNRNVNSLNESIFKNKNVSEDLNTFIKPNENTIDYQKKLEDELFIIKNSSNNLVGLNEFVSNSESESDSVSSGKSSSSVRIERISRKKQSKKRSIQKESLKQLKQLLNNDSDNLTSDLDM